MIHWGKEVRRRSRGTGSVQSPRPTMDTIFSKECHSEERSDVGIRIPLVRVQFVGKYELPHQCAHRFAMTRLL